MICWSSSWIESENRKNTSPKNLTPWANMNSRQQVVVRSWQLTAKPAQVWPSLVKLRTLFGLGIACVDKSCQCHPSTWMKNEYVSLRCLVDIAMNVLRIDLRLLVEGCCCTVTLQCQSNIKAASWVPWRSYLANFCDGIMVLSLSTVCAGVASGNIPISISNHLNVRDWYCMILMPQLCFAQLSTKTIDQFTGHCYCCIRQSVFELRTMVLIVDEAPEPEPDQFLFSCRLTHCEHWSVVVGALTVEQKLWRKGMVDNQWMTENFAACWAKTMKKGNRSTIEFESWIQNSINDKLIKILPSLFSTKNMRESSLNLPGFQNFRWLAFACARMRPCHVNPKSK